MAPIPYSSNHNLLIGVNISHSSYSTLITLFSEPDPPEQSVIILMDANSTHLTFSVLSPVIPYCSRTSYSIVASNCGSCPESTKSATIVCNNFTTSVETNICNLIVGAVFCGSVLGERTSFLADLRGR